MSRTLLIDNHDSFTYNLAALIVTATGEKPVVVRNDAATWDALRGEGFDRIVISPGPGRPQRRRDLGLSADAILQADVPILGVCLGHQAIGHLYGATIGLAHEPVHGRVDRIRHLGDDLFAGIPDAFEATRYHSLAVSDLPAALTAIAWSADGTLMALRHVSRLLWGVQFHPESICTEHGETLIRNFFALSARAVPARTDRSASAAAAPAEASAAWGALCVHARRCPGAATPQDAFTRLFGDARTAFWLDSSQSHHHDARFSYFGDAGGPYAEFLRYESTGRRLRIETRDGVEERRESVFDYLEAQLAARAKPLHDDVPFDFNCGYVGYFGYELKGELHGDHAHRATTPDACWIFADRLIAFDHATGEYWLLCLDDARGPGAENRRWIEHVQSVLASAVRRDDGASGRAVVGGLDRLRWRHSPAQYLAAIRRAKALIREGETYEVCLTNEITAEVEADPLPVYAALRSANPVPFGALLRFDDISILCTSPELYLGVSSDGDVESRPIKGTAPRHPDPSADRASARNLAGSIKDRAENLMIVDLLRNDLNRCCETGSVHVPRLFDVESFATVHQLVSTIRGRLDAGCSAIDCVRASFPGGSMTGAPKVRTMRILDELEAGARGVYSGSIGYLALAGAAKLNIVIRTIVMAGARLSIGAGGAIVALSDPEQELAEVMLKARAQLEVLQRLAADGARPAAAGDIATGTAP